MRVIWDEWRLTWDDIEGVDVRVAMNDTAASHHKRLSDVYWIDRRHSRCLRRFIILVYISPTELWFLHLFCQEKNTVRWKNACVVPHAAFSSLNCSFRWAVGCFITVPCWSTMLSVKTFNQSTRWCVRTFRAEKVFRKNWIATCDSSYQLVSSWLSA